MSNKRILPSPHPWRLCPFGKHWVKEHDRKVLISSKNPFGLTSVEGHCRTNPSKQEILIKDEILEIAKLRIKDLKILPKADTLGFPNGNTYDQEIGLWTQFWNEIYNPDISLDPNIVKALIASESGFKSEISTKTKLRGTGRANGLIQITESTRKILQDIKGELKNYLVFLSKEDIYDPNLNLAAGICWLFHKRDLLSIRLKRSATWEESVMEYKGLNFQIEEGGKEAIKIKNKFETILKRLREK